MNFNSNNYNPVNSRNWFLFYEISPESFFEFESSLNFYFEKIKKDKILKDFIFYNEKNKDESNFIFSVYIEFTSLKRKSAILKSVSNNGIGKFYNNMIDIFPRPLGLKSYDVIGNFKSNQKKIIENLSLIEKKNVDVNLSSHTQKDKDSLDYNFGIHSFMNEFDPSVIDKEFLLIKKAVDNYLINKFDDAVFFDFELLIGFGSLIEKNYKIEIIYIVSLYILVYYKFIKESFVWGVEFFSNVYRIFDKTYLYNNLSLYFSYTFKNEDGYESIKYISEDDLEFYKSYSIQKKNSLKQNENRYVTLHSIFRNYETQVRKYADAVDLLLYYRGINSHIFQERKIKINEKKLRGKAKLVSEYFLKKKMM